MSSLRNPRAEPYLFVLRSLLTRGVRSLIGLASVLFLVTFAAGCAGLPTTVLRTPSTAIKATKETKLETIVEASSPDRALSGFRLLPSGAFALSTRLELARRSEQSLDLQYYLIKSDATGKSMLRALRDASRRGVRVRLLLDDLNTSGQDALLLGLAAEPNVEVRLFNPFPAGRQRMLTRFAASLFDFRRLNRRMHNKLFIADGAMAVAGGRNIADEYFTRHLLANFIDLDVFASGAIVPELARLFDEYWNSPAAYPLESIAVTGEPRAELQARFEEVTISVLEPMSRAAPATDVLGYGPISEELDDGKLGLAWSSAEAFADAPGMASDDKSFRMDLHEPSTRVRFNVLEHIRDSSDEAVLVSPYFIPGAEGMEMIRAARERGVNISVLTNSLASTDQPLVHTAYLRYRDELLKLGVDLYELSPIRAGRETRRFMFGASVGGLHTKAAVFDDDKLFIGSMNFDPRSERYNTELGLFIHSPEIAREAGRLARFGMLQGAHRLRLTAAGRLERLMLGAADEVHVEEPEAGFWVRMLLRLFAPLVPEELL
ncbi:phospholipase D family protein [Schlegelella sp. ID0723]|uniref:Phospholipase D family protein n=2 Tax=Piscinibacter koreensis TaxID=2742824 RepID=A0A7Y6NSH8_9BURK|nr:phospholipase D family protein [Schlegelella koreensis]